MFTKIGINVKRFQCSAACRFCFCCSGLFQVCFFVWVLQFIAHRMIRRIKSNCCRKINQINSVTIMQQSKRRLSHCETEKKINVNCITYKVLLEIALLYRDFTIAIATNRKENRQNEQWGARKTANADMHDLSSGTYRSVAFCSPFSVFRFVSFQTIRIQSIFRAIRSPAAKTAATRAQTCARPKMVAKFALNCELYKRPII